MFRRRETMIALRARRQAFRIASKVAHPRLDQPEQPLAVDAPADAPTKFRLYDDSDISSILLIGAVLVGFVCIVLFVR